MFLWFKNFSQSRTRSPSRLWVARRAGRPEPCGASPADSRSPRCWQTPGLRAKGTPKRQRRKVALALADFFFLTNRGTCKRCGRCRFGCEQQQRRILMVTVVAFDRKATNVRIWKRWEAAQRWNHTEATKATWSATDAMKGTSKERKKKHVRMINCGHGWTQWGGVLHKCGVDRGSGKRG